MNEELKAALKAELESFKASLPQIQDVKSLETAFNAFKSEITTKFEGLDKSDEIAKLTEAVQKQGETITALKLQGDNAKQKTFRDVLVANKAKLEAMANGTEKRITFDTTTKDVLSANFTDRTLAYREPGVGQIQRGMPFMADLFPKVVLGSNMGGTVRWNEQLAVTNNAGAVAEATAPGTQSNLTWVEKSIEGKRLADFVKVGLDQIKDVDFVLGEVQALVNKNMKLAENAALTNGDGLNNNMTGIATYATEFVTAGASKVVAPNMVDLVNKIALQIMIDMKGGAFPTNFVASPIDIQPLKEAKDPDGRYIFENWALGQNPAFGGISYVANPLVTADTLICGDFTLGTLFIFDDLLIEMVRTGTDEIDRKVTIFAYKRENLRVKDVDRKAFVKVSSIKSALDAIDAAV